jgi:hypothetical protein
MDSHCQSDFIMSAGTSRSRGGVARGVAEVARGNIMLRVVAVVCGSVIVLGIGVAAGAGIAQSLPLSILVPGKLAEISPDRLATWLVFP